jgi:hypothetical protein
VHCRYIILLVPSALAVQDNNQPTSSNHNVISALQFNKTSYLMWFPVRITKIWLMLMLILTSYERKKYCSFAEKYCWNNSNEQGVRRVLWRCRIVLDTGRDSSYQLLLYYFTLMTPASATLLFGEEQSVWCGVCDMTAIQSSLAGSNHHGRWHDQQTVIIDFSFTIWLSMED